MYCPNCGQIIPEDAIFCNNCGSKISTSSNTCIKCGALLNDGDVFCGECGTNQETYISSEKNNINIEENGSNTEPNARQIIFEDKKENIAPINKPTNYNEFNMSSEFQQTGTPTNVPITQNPKKIKNKSGNNSLAIYIMLGTIVILICFIAAMLLIPRFTGDDDATESPDTSYVETTETPADEEEKSDVEEEEKAIVNEIDNSKISSIIDQHCEHTDFGIFVQNLNNGYEYGYNKDNVFLASAMCQVVILNTLSNTVEQKDLDINEEQLYFNYMPNGKEAPNSKNENKTNITLKKCIEDIAIYGDNNKSNHLVDYIGDVNDAYSGFDIINNTLRNNGYYDTKINRKTYINPDYIDQAASPNTTTPYEICKIFENLINSGNLGSKSYMKNIFKSVSNNGQAIGLKKFVPEDYNVCNVNALNSQSTNNVAIIDDGNTELVIAILSTTEESKTNIENNDVREKVVDDIVDYIISTQFEN